MSDIKDIAVSTRPRRRWLRALLLIGVPLIAAGAGLDIYLNGGRYISTDNAYVAAQKVLVTPEISGKVDAIMVSEGQRLAAGDVLFTIDRKPFELALAEARAAVARAANDYAGLKERHAGLTAQIALAGDTVRLRQGVFDRKQSLRASRVVSESDVDNDLIALQQAKAALEVLEQARRDVESQLGGDVGRPLDTYAPWASAKAAADRAQWNLDQTVLRAPLAGVATQVSNIQLGRYLTAGATVFAIVSDSGVWIDANPKETDITYLAQGQEAAVTVDAFPGKPLKGHVASISPGTGSQFSLIPAQNAAGNWVKVVQRVPVRIEFDRGQDTARLRTGMSVTVDIDTRRNRTLAGLLGLEAAAQPASP